MTEPPEPPINSLAVLVSVVNDRFARMRADVLRTIRLIAIAYVILLAGFATALGLGVSYINGQAERLQRSQIRDICRPLEPAVLARTVSVLRENFHADNAGIAATIRAAQEEARLRLREIGVSECPPPSRPSP